MDYVNENTTIGTTIDRELSWARSDFDRTHTTSSARSTSCLGSGQEMDERRHARHPHWRVAAERSFVAQSGQSLTIAATARCSHAGPECVRQPERRTEVLGGSDPDGSTSIPPSTRFRSRRAGQHEAAQRPRRAGLLTSTCRCSSASGPAAAATPRCAWTPTTRRTRCVGRIPRPVQRRHRQHLRPGHRHDGGQRTFRSAAGSLSRTPHAGGVSTPPLVLCRHGHPSL